MTILDHLHSSSSSSSFAKTHDNYNNNFNYNYNNYDDAPYMLLSLMDNVGGSSGGLDLRGRTWNSPYNDTSKGDGTWFINKRYE